MLNPLRDKNQVVNMEACLYRGAEEKTPVITACPERAERERERELEGESDGFEIIIMMIIKA